MNLLRLWSRWSWTGSQTRHITIYKQPFNTQFFYLHIQKILLSKFHNNIWTWKSKVLTLNTSHYIYIYIAERRSNRLWAALFKCLFTELIFWLNFNKSLNWQLGLLARLTSVTKITRFIPNKNFILFNTFRLFHANNLAEYFLYFVGHKTCLLIVWKKLLHILYI
jgi:hypothetical protein